MNFNKQFAEILTLAQKARYNAFKSVNAELVNLYWQVGEYISRKVKIASFGIILFGQNLSNLEIFSP